MTNIEIQQQAQKAIRAYQSKSGLINKPIINGRFCTPHFGVSDGTQQSMTYQWNFVTRINCTGVQFCFGNWSLGNSTNGTAVNTLGANDITIAAAVFSAKKVYFNGNDTITLKPGATVWSDPFYGKFIAGQNNLLLVNVSVATLGQTWPIGLTTNQTNEGWANGNVTTSGSITVASVKGYHPFAAIGIPQSQLTFPNIAVCGDSIAMGSIGDTQDYGWIKRGLDTANIPFIRVGCGGAKMADFNTSTTFTHPALSGCDIVLNNFGANDISTWTDLLTAQAAYISWWYMQYYAGAKVIQSTVLPRNSFTTAQNAIRTGLNDWLRDGAPMSAGAAVAVGTAGALRVNQTGHPLYKIIEVADLAETARNSNIWKTGYSTDGVHPNTTGAPALAAAIVASDFML